ncbi:Calx-beta domain-containing protein [Alphaproteobacteria bacterium]|nr:Calx-beta domain-containing protein [Alphaproteobacteria bacterium]
MKKSAKMSLCQYIKSYIAGLLLATLLPGAAFAVDIDISDATTPDEAAVNQTIAVFISSDATVSVDYTIIDGTATNGDDYTASSGTLNFSPGNTVQSINIPILSDDIDEDIETVIINLSNPTGGAVIVDNQATLYIVDDDPEPQISINDDNTTETNGTYSLAATLNNPSSKDVSVGWRAIAGTASDGSDFNSSQGTLNFPAGNTSQNISISLLDDSMDEDNETVIVTLYDPIFATLDNSTAVITLQDDDAEPSISAADITTTDESVANITISLSAPSSRTVAVLATTSGITATEGTDYTATSTNVQIPPGNTFTTLSIPLNDDTLDELNETFEVGFSNPSNASIFDNNTVVTISDNDLAPSVSISGQTIVDDNGTLAPQVTLSAASGLTVEVDYATSNGTATAGNDYTTTNGTLTFTAGQTTLPLSIPILGDVVDEEDEIFSVTLSNPDNATLGTATASMLITDNDPAPTISVADISTADETATSTNVVATLSAASEKVITIDYTTSDGTADAGSDYTAANGTITFAPGVTTQNIPVAILADAIDEANETVTITLSNPSGNPPAVVINDGTAVLTISDDDLAPAISIDDVTTASEVGIGQQVTVRLNNASEQTVTVDYTTSDVTAWAGDDYTADNGIVTFNPGSISETISIPILQDSIDEINETFEIQLSNPSNATIADNTSIVTITDDETTPSLSITGSSASDDNGTLTATVNLSGASALIVEVDYATSNGTATAGNDYVATSSTLTFTPGQTSKPISLTILGDVVDEEDEIFSVTLSNPDNATLGTATASMLITDNDPAPTISVADISTVDESASSTNVVATLSTASEKVITIDYTTSDGTATAGNDYTAANGTITFAPGVTTQNIPVAILADTVDEANETVTVTLSNPSGNPPAVVINDGTAVLTISDDDLAPAISIDDVTTASEVGIGQQVTVWLNTASEQTVTVDYTTSDVTAWAGDDYTADSGTVTFNPGSISEIISIPILQDSIDEINETFEIQLSNPSNATIADNTSIVTITDDEGLPTMTVQDFTTLDETAGNITATVSLSAASSLNITANYSTADVSATAGSDYAASAGPLTFAPGDTSKTITIAIMSDSVDEINETFEIQLSNVVNAVASSSPGSITITDDDNEPSISISDNSTTDETAGATNLSVALSAASEKTITIDYTTSDGTATAGSDYTAANGTITFAPGVSTQNIPVAILADTEDEDNETISVSLSNPSNVSINDGMGTLSITDDDLPPSVFIDDLTTINEAAVNQNIVVRLSSPSQKTVSVDYATSDGTAVAGADYVADNGTVTFNPGVTTQNVQIAILDDQLDEVNEAFNINLSNFNNASSGDNSSIVTITDDEGLPTLSAQDNSTIAETGSIGATVTLSAPSAKTVTVAYFTADISAAAASDYTSTTGIFTFAPGEITKSVSIPITADTIDEENETFRFEISNPSNAVVAVNQATMTITDDDSAPTISISDNTTINEASGATPLTVTLSAASERIITVNYTTANGTANSAADYVATNGTLTFNANVTSQTIPISILQDALDEPNETISVNLSGPTNATILDGNGVLTITDDDNAPSITIDDATTNNEASISQPVSIHLSAPSAQIVTVDWATQDATAVAGATGDYVASSNTATFAAGETTKQINVPILDDSLDEANETFEIRLSNATNASISDNTSIVTITDDEGLPSLSVQNLTHLTENNQAAVMVTLNSASALPVTVNYATSDGTAIAGNDYTFDNGTLTFAPTVTSMTIPITVLPDTIDEENETFSLNLSSPTNAVLGTASGTVTITDDDSAPTISISDNTTINEASGATPLTVTLSAASERVITFNYTTANGTANSGTDYVATSGTLTFNPNITSLPIPISIIQDAVDEPNETIIVNLSSAVNASIADGSGTLTINDDDGLPSITIDDVVTASEIAANQSITLRLSGASENNVTVDWSTQNGSATASSDYQNSSGTATFAANTTTTTIAVPILSDNLSEANETFNILLANPTNAVIGDNSSIVTITDDDSLTISIADASTVDETQALQPIVVSLSNASTSTVTVDYATTDNTASSGSDYTMTSGTLTFNPGIVQQTINVPILADTDQEGTENFTVNLSNATGGASISDGQASVTIVDDDGAPTITVANLSVNENSGTNSAAVTLSIPSTQTISVNYSFVSGTADNTTDYTGANGTLFFAPGDLSEIVSFTIVDDTTYEGNETFSIVLSNPTNAVLGNASSTITIVENDQLLSNAETQEIKDSLIFGKNSTLRTETTFMNRVLVRNRDIFFNGMETNTQSYSRFDRLDANISEKRDYVNFAFSGKNIADNNLRRTSWNVSGSTNKDGLERAENLDAIFSVDSLDSNKSNNTSWETAVSHSKNNNGVKNSTVSTALNFSHKLSDNHLFGYILGFGFGNTSISNDLQGTNLSRSASLGLYTSYEINDGLIFDLMYSKTFEKNELDTTVSGKTVKGEFDRNSSSISATLQGVYRFSSSELRPTFTYTTGKSIFNNAYFDISQGSLSTTQQLDFGSDEYYSLSFTPELKILIGSKTNLIRPNGFNLLKLRPKYFCEKYNSQANENCGMGLGIGLGNHHPTYLYNQDLTVDYEKIDSTTTYSLRYKRTY